MCRPTHSDRLSEAFDMLSVVGSCPTMDNFNNTQEKLSEEFRKTLDGGWKAYTKLRPTEKGLFNREFATHFGTTPNEMRMIFDCKKGQPNLSKRYGVNQSLARSIEAFNNRLDKRALFLIDDNIKFKNQLQTLNAIKNAKDMDTLVSLIESSVLSLGDVPMVKEYLDKKTEIINGIQRNAGNRGILDSLHARLMALRKEGKDDFEEIYQSSALDAIATRLGEEIVDVAFEEVGLIMIKTL